VYLRFGTGTPDPRLNSYGGISDKEIEMKTRTKTGTTLIAAVAVAFLATGADARAASSHGIQVTTIASWFSDLWSLLGNPRRCSRCHDKPLQ
jgi:hypothetical protein